MEPTALVNVEQWTHSICNPIAGSLIPEEYRKTSDKKLSQILDPTRFDWEKDGYYPLFCVPYRIHPPRYSKYRLQRYIYFESSHFKVSAEKGESVCIGWIWDEKQLQRCKVAENEVVTFKIKHLESKVRTSCSGHYKPKTEDGFEMPNFLFSSSLKCSVKNVIIHRYSGQQYCGSI